MTSLKSKITQYQFMSPQTYFSVEHDDDANKSVRINSAPQRTCFLEIKELDDEAALSIFRIGIDVMEYRFCGAKSMIGYLR